MTQTGRRHFIGGLLAAGLMPAPTWADAGSPAFLSAAATADGAHMLCGIGADLGIVFQRPLPGRGHAAAAHPTRPEAVAFARRPGTFAVVIDCRSGDERALLQAPPGRHFFGHGAFSQDGDLLYTTENDYEGGRGRIGIWDAAGGYERIGEFDSGGIGPHEIKRLPGTDTLVIANGGIDTHPDSGRAKLNIPTMRPNLAYIERGDVVERVEPPEAMHKNSIRHLAVSAAGTVAFGMQWQGEGNPPALVGRHDRGGQMTFMQADDDALRQMAGYIGSVAFGPDGRSIAVTSPRGGRVQVFDSRTGALTASTAIADVCGVAAQAGQIITTSGTGAIRRLGGRAREGDMRHPSLRFDNHLIALS
ncbi:DUF1513 domain-containing protein [Thalassococcus sp. BH17M4-6]|uniref:DUF1513 domain-containing protein n=1 Tax=Thalassococcus sp. BH17M4-6 TaxID=3413148 RepID=UPI003BBD39E3